MGSVVIHTRKKKVVKSKFKKNKKVAKLKAQNDDLLEEVKIIILDKLKLACNAQKSWEGLSKFLNKNGHSVGTLRGEVLYYVNSTCGTYLREPKRIIVKSEPVERPTKKNTAAKSAKKEPVKKREKDKFYSSPAWRMLRYQAIKRDGATCQLCGRTRKHGVVLHVDHIKPRSTHPKLELDLHNLQTLCEDCNMGKGNGDEIDWR